VRVPVWLTLGAAALVILYGVYRIRIAITSKATPEERATARGHYAMRPRTHLLMGIVYLMLGGGLIATSFGWNPFGNLFGPDTAVPSKDKAPTKNGVPIDQLPAPKT